MSTTQKLLDAHVLPEVVLSNLSPFLESVAQDLGNHIKKTGNVRIVNPKNSALEHQAYDISVFHAIVAILNSIETLRRVQKFIKNFPSPNKYKKDGISYFMWIEYHYVYFIITLVGILDMALILTNEVFRLGYQEEDCKFGLVTNNLWIKNTPVKKALEKLNKVIKPHKTPRNLYVHRGQSPRIDLLIKSEFYDLLKFITSTELLTNKSLLNKKISDFGYRNESKKIINYLEEEISKIIQAVSDLFDSLHKKYDQNSRLLHKVYELRLKK